MAIGNRNTAINIKRKKQNFLYRFFIAKGIWQLYLLSLIPVTFVIVFHYLPIGGIMMAFKDFSFRDGIWGSPWVGIRYFEQLTNTPIFIDILKNTLIISILSIVVGFPFPIILAFAFNEVRNQRIKKTIQTIMFAPYFISTVVVVSIMVQMFSFRYGVVNEVIKLLGDSPVNFIAAPSFFRPAYVLSGVWQGAGFASVLYIAALSAIDVTLYEAAYLDGASRLQRLRYIDLPGIAPTIIITLILTTGGILNVGFEKVFLMQNPVNYRVSEVISTYVYNIGIQQVQFSFATAVGLFNSVINCIILLLVNWFARQMSETSLF